MLYMISVLSHFWRLALWSVLIKGAGVPAKKCVLQFLGAMF